MTRFLLILSVLTLGCQASANGQMSANSGERVQVAGEAGKVPDKEETRPLPQTDTEKLSQAQQTDSASRVSTTPLGARAGLRLAKPGVPTCRCLAVAVGRPDDARMQWEGSATTIDPGWQLAIALSSEGVDCAGAPRDSLGASYQGYELSGKDVVVLVEVARLGRPIAGGAIIPRPESTGRVLIRPVDSKTPYGRALDGALTPCIVWTSP